MKPSDDIRRRAFEIAHKEQVLVGAQALVAIAPHHYQQAILDFLDVRLGVQEPATPAVQCSCNQNTASCGVHGYPPYNWYNANAHKCKCLDGGRRIQGHDAGCVFDRGGER